MYEGLQRIYSIAVRGDNLPVWVALGAVIVLAALAFSAARSERDGGR